MPKQSKPEIADEAAACLPDLRGSLRELCAEFRAAISALASNDLASLQTSIVTQEKLADRLRSAMQRQSALAGLAPLEVRELKYVTRFYSGLLERSLRSVRLRAALCRTFKQHFASAPGTPAGETSWSCEA